MIYENLPFADYRKLDGLNASLLKPYSISPRYGKYCEQRGFTQSSAMNMGSLVHSYVLEGEEAAKQLLAESYILDGFPVHESGRYEGKMFGENTKQFKAWLEEQQPYARYLFPDQVEQCLDIARAVQCNPVANMVLADCPRRETALTWEIEGVKCKAMIDFYGLAIAGDLKTTGKRLTKRNLERAILDFDYALQFSFYQDGLIANGMDIEEFVAIFVQNKDELDCATMVIDYDTYLYGQDQYMKAIENYKSVEHISDFRECPGLHSEMMTGGVPGYIKDNDESFVNEIMGMNNAT